MNPDLSFRPENEECKGLGVFIEEACCAHIFPNGKEIDVNNVALTVDDLEVIAKKMKEVQKHGMPVPICEICAGTPYFPNMRLADKVFEEHVCTAPMHVNRPR